MNEGLSLKMGQCLLPVMISQHMNMNPSTNTHGTWAVINCQATDALGHISDDTNLIILGTIASAVYNHQQQQFIHT